MKKVLFFALAAGVALVACTKNEVKPVNVDQEITYQTISTKGGASAMNEANHFISYAYFLEKDKKWDTDNDRKGASAYISAADISYDRQTNCWKAASPYYWPKQGSLTFFAWSTNNESPSLTPNKPTCSTAKGIEVSSYDITANKNVDFLVAEIVKDQTQNKTQVDGKTWAKGVPTVFKHTLSKLAFQVQTVDNSGNAKDYTSEKIKFNVKSITLKSVKNKLAYAQTWGTGAAASGHVWSDIPRTTEQISVPVFTGDYEANSTAKTLTKGTNDYDIVIPQTFDNSASTEDLLEIQYDITTSYTGSDVVEHVILPVKLSDVYTNNWEVNKFYTLLIKLSMNEIFWAPTVEEWEKVNATEQTF